MDPPYPPLVAPDTPGATTAPSAIGIAAKRFIRRFMPLFVKLDGRTVGEVYTGDTPEVWKGLNARDCGGEPRFRPPGNHYRARTVAFTESGIALTAAQSPFTRPTFNNGTAARGSLPRLAGVGPKNRQNQPLGPW